MDKSPSTNALKGSTPPPGGHLQKAATTSLAAAWLVYRSFLAGPVAQVVPEPTREAVFQLFCDIRANVPKDKRFLQRHARAFTPQTKIGWLALSGVLGYAVSAALLVTTLTLGISVAGLSMGLMAVLATGAFLASALGFMAFVLFTSAFVVGAVAFTALSGYVVGSSSLAVMRHITQLVFGNGVANAGVKANLASSSADMQQNKNTNIATATTTTTRMAAPGAAAAPPSASPVNVTEDKLSKTARPSTYAAPRAVLPPIKTASPTKKRSPPATTSAASPPARSTSSPGIMSAQKEENTSGSYQVEEQQAAPLSPASTTWTSTSTAANDLATPKTAAIEDVEKETEKNNVITTIGQGETTTTAAAVTSKPISDKTFVAIKTNSTTPSGTRTITMIKPNTTTVENNNPLKKKTSSPAPLPGPPPLTAGLLKPISPATTLDTCAQDKSLSSSSHPSPTVNSSSINDDTIDSDDSPGAFSSVMQNWKEIEKKAALESPSGSGVAKLPIPHNGISSGGSKSKGKSSRKSSPTPLENANGVAAPSTLVPKTPET